jgi:hypothetical protein
MQQQSLQASAGTRVYGRNTACRTHGKVSLSLPCTLTIINLSLKENPYRLSLSMTVGQLERHPGEDDHVAFIHTRSQQPAPPGPLPHLHTFSERHICEVSSNATLWPATDPMLRCALKLDEGTKRRATIPEARP